MKLFSLLASLIFLAFPALGAQLKNGSPLFHQLDKDLPRSILILSFKGGPSQLTSSQQGAVSVLKEMMSEGPKTLSLQDYRDKQFGLSTTIDYGSDVNVFTVYIKAPKDSIEEGLKLFLDTVKNPRSTDEDFKRYHARILAGLQAGFESMSTVNSYFAPRDFLNYGYQTKSGETSPTSFAKIKLGDVKIALGKLLNFGHLFVTYVGPDSESEIQTTLNKALTEKFKSKYVDIKAQKTSPPRVTKLKYTVLEKPGATDNQILFLFPQSVARDKPGWVDAVLTMDLLGGGLHGRLGKTLRSERGLTYGAHSYFDSPSPFWAAATFGGLEQTPGLLTGVPEVIEKYLKTEITAEEVEESKERVLNSIRAQKELPKDRASRRAWYFVNGFDISFYDRIESEFEKGSLERVNKFRSQLQAKNAGVYLMGDSAKLLKNLEAMGVKPAQVRVVPLTDVR